MTPGLTGEVLFAYLHLAAIVLTVAFLLSEWLLCGPDLQPPIIRLLGRIDLLYFGCAMLALATGAVRVFLFGKGYAFYVHNPVFFVKLGLFVAVGLISIAPTIQFMRWNRLLRAGATRIASSREIARTRAIIALELLLIAFIPLCAVLMARGIGLPI
jgi:putative membrane protein